MRHQYAALTSSDLVGATNKNTAKLIMILNRETRSLFVDNSLDVPVAIYLVHPDAEPPTVSASGLFWLEISPYRVINYQDMMGGFTIDTRTQIHIHYVGSTAPTVGDQYKVRIAAWG